MSSYSALRRHNYKKYWHYGVFHTRLSHFAQVDEPEKKVLLLGTVFVRALSSVKWCEEMLCIFLLDLG